MKDEDTKKWEQAKAMYTDPEEAIRQMIRETQVKEILKDVNQQALQNYVQGAKMKKPTGGQSLTASQIVSQQSASSNTAGSWTGGSMTATQAGSAAPAYGPIITTGGSTVSPWGPYTTSGTTIPFNPPYVTMRDISGAPAAFGYSDPYITEVGGAVANITEDLKEWNSIGFVGGLMRYLWWKDKHSGGKHLLSLAFFDKIMLRLVTVTDPHEGKIFKDWRTNELIDLIEDNGNLVLERKFKSRHDVLKYFFTRELGEDAGIWKIAENL